MKKRIIHFAHANGFPGGSYRLFLSFFRKDYRLVVVDRLGHNDRFPINNNWSNLADEVIDSIERNSDSPVIGMGHSLGSIVTFMAAHKRPDLFRYIIMLDPPFFTGLTGRIFYLLKETGLSDFVTPAGKSKGRKRIWNDMDDVNGYFRSKGLFRAFHPEVLEDYISNGVVESGDVYTLYYDVETEVGIFRTMPDNLGKYHRINGVAGTIIHGESSRAVHKSSLRRFAAVQNFRLTTSPGGHLFPLEQPYEAASVVSGELALLESILNK